jgi:hypothetical protein
MTKVVLGAIIGLIIGAVLGILLNWSRFYLVHFMQVNLYGPERLGGAACGAIIGAIAGATKAIVDAVKNPRH